MDNELDMAYISKNNGYTYGIKTLAQIEALTGMQTGDTAYCTSNSRVMTYDGNFWMCDDFVVMVNRSGLTLNQWDVVIVESSGITTEASCNTTISAGSPKVAGVVVYSSINGSNCVIAIKGNYKANSSIGSVKGAPQTTSGTARKVQDNTAFSTSEGVFAFSLTDLEVAGVIDVIIMAKKELN